MNKLPKVEQTEKILGKKKVPPTHPKEKNRHEQKKGHRFGVPTDGEPPKNLVLEKKTQPSGT